MSNLRFLPYLATTNRRITRFLPTTMSTQRMPLCWGHRGASADLPENTIASFESSARAGSDGIESDVHITSDGYLVMFHDPELGRTTRGGSGSINTQPYKGNIEKLTTLKKPEQKIPTFDETIEWFIRPENSHMVLNIDVKANNDPERLFSLMKAIIDRHDSWETTIAPRLILGLWHPKFVLHAMRILPTIPRCFIGINLDLAQTPIFWDNCNAFSIAFPILGTLEGARFRQRCKEEGKGIYTWTLNDQEEWITSAEWGLDVVMTDKPTAYIATRRTAIASSTPLRIADPWFMWKKLRYYSLYLWLMRRFIIKRLETLGGPLAPYLAITGARTE